ncbi:MAG: MFS transporter [Promethearchaeota archaeon]
MGLRNSATVSVYLSYALQATALAMSWQFVSLFVKHDLGAPDFLTITIVWAAPAFINIVAVNIWGALSDRAGARKPFMIIGFFGYALTFSLYSFVYDSFQYLVVAMAGAVISSAALPVGQALLTTNVENKGERLGYFISAQSAGWFFGALSSGLLYDILGMAVLYRIAAVFCVAALVTCLLFVRDVPVEANLDTPSSSLITILREPGMLRLVGAVGLSQIGMNAVSFMMSIMIVDELGGQAYYVGLANSAATLIAVVITGYIGKLIDRKGPAKILVISMVSYVVFAFGFAIVNDPVAASIMWALPIYPLSSTAAYALGAFLSDRSERGRAMSLVSGAQNTGSAVGPVVGGLFAQYVFNSVQPISWINMLFNAAGFILAFSLIGLAASRNSSKAKASDNTEFHKP